MDETAAKRFEKALKVYYAKKHGQLMGRASPFWKEVVKRMETGIQGKNWAIKTAIGTSTMGSSTFLEAQKSASGRKWLEFVVTVDKYFSVVTLENLSILLSRTDAGAEVRNWLDNLASQGHADDRRRAGDFHGDGIPYLGKVKNSSTGSKTVTFFNGLRVMNFLNIGQVCQFGVVGSAENDDKLTVEKLSQVEQDGTIKVIFDKNCPITRVAGGSDLRAIAVGDTTASKESFLGNDSLLPVTAPTGNDAVVLGVDTSISPFLQPKRFKRQNASTDIADIIIQALQTVNQTDESKNPDAIFAHPKTLTKLQTEIRSNVRYADFYQRSGKGTVGFSQFQFASPFLPMPLPIMGDVFLDEDVIRIPNYNSYCLGSSLTSRNPVELSTQDGNRSLRSATQAALEARNESYLAMAVKEPAANIVIDLKVA